MKLFKRLNSEEYDTLTKRITDVSNSITVLATTVKSLQLENDDLRNKVLRKIQKPRLDSSTELASQEPPHQYERIPKTSLDFSMTEQDYMRFIGGN